YTAGWISLKRQYSTIGFIGLNEYLINKGLSLLNSTKGVEEAISVLQKIEKTAMSWQESENQEKYTFMFDKEEKTYLASELLTVRHKITGVISTLEAEKLAGSFEEYEVDV
ncbi:MAG: hypothetical protein PHV06_12630, partial [bacterium]|nr:hypothetical protein [bacterium]